MRADSAVASAETTVSEALSALDEVVRSPDALARITGAVRRAVQALTGATAVCITVWDEQNDIMRALPGAFGSTDRNLPASMTGPVSNLRSSAARTFTTGRPYLSNSASGDPNVLQGYVDLFMIERIMCVPLTYGKRPIGVLILANKPADFTDTDIHAVQRIGSRIAMSVELARLFTRVRLQQRLEAVLADAAVAIASGLSVRDCLLPAFRKLSAVTDATVVALISQDGRAPLVWRRGPQDEALERRLTTDARQLAGGSAGAYPQSAGDPGWASLHAPVELYGERTATLSMLRRNGEPFGNDEAGVLGRLANITALAWATERYQHQLAELARARERDRIGDELHDRVAQILFAAQLGLDSVLEDSYGAGADLDLQRIAEVRALLTKGDRVIRDVITHLGSQPDEGLSRRIRLVVDEVEEEFGVAVHVDITDEAAVNKVSRRVADCVVRIAREATVNAAKHAGPCRIRLDLFVDESNRAVIRVSDDGLGVTGPAEDDRRGIRSLRRAAADSDGTLRISRSRHGLGTCVTGSFSM
ncbi:MAG: hypothetical protein NVS3B1_18460 [Marmoricola sp.]